MTKQWIADAIGYWSERVYEGDIGVDWSEADTRCWRCGSERTLQRCHIVAKQFDGAEGPENIIPLCRMCHDEAPDVTDPSEMWRWVKETRSQFYGTLSAERAIAIVIARGVDISRFDVRALQEAGEQIGVHFMQSGAGATIKPASWAWAIEQACKGPKKTAQQLSDQLAEIHRDKIEQLDALVEKRKKETCDEPPQKEVRKRNRRAG